jgi:hypothetical protein
MKGRKGPERKAGAKVRGRGGSQGLPPLYTIKVEAPLPFWYGRGLSRGHFRAKGLNSQSDYLENPKKLPPRSPGGGAWGGSGAEWERSGAEGERGWRPKRRRALYDKGELGSRVGGGDGEANEEKPRRKGARRPSESR